MINKTSLSDFVNKIQEREPFAFSRWGDGEWQSVLGRDTGTNCDRHKYFPQMGAELREVLTTRPQYMLGMQNFTLSGKLGPKVLKWLDEAGLNDIYWYNADVFHYAAIRNKLDSLIEILNTVPVIVVGPDHLKRLKSTIPFLAFVDVPPQNAYLSLRRILRDTLSILEARTDYCVVSISASMPAEILIDRIAKTSVGKEHALVDFGSLWDPYVGVKSRSYMRKKK